ncbi:MAG: rhomboid family intramembrane serine protease [Cyclobacteriaceae bacterium]|jgi:membrane associated rhomboid family serine protease|nr:rhomboid family intramembrane serine protease [Cyclobacteriaceae bacterium]
MPLTLTLVIILITVGVSLYTMQKPQVLNKLMNNPYQVVHSGQYYRLLTSGFIHRDHMHLIFNMFSFYFFGTQLEYIFKEIFGSLGQVHFIILYMMGIIVSDLPTVFKHRNNIYYNSLGASGAVSAVVFACILFLPLRDICFYGVLCFPGFVLGLGYLGYSFYRSKKSADGINHDAHLYGSLFGIIYCIIFYPDSIRIFLEQMGEWKIPFI